MHSTDVSFPTGLRASSSRWHDALASAAEARTSSIDRSSARGPDRLDVSDDSHPHAFGSFWFRYSLSFGVVTAGFSNYSNEQIETGSRPRGRGRVTSPFLGRFRGPDLTPLPRAGTPTNRGVLVVDMVGFLLLVWRGFMSRTGFSRLQLVNSYRRLSGFVIR